MKDIPKYLASTAFGALIGSLIAGQSVLSLILVAGLALIGATWIGYRIMRDPETCPDCGFLFSKPNPNCDHF